MSETQTDEVVSACNHTVLTRTEAAAYLKTSVQTLHNYAALKTGPKYYRPGGGKVIYRMSDLDDWINSSPSW